MFDNIFIFLISYVVSAVDFLNIPAFVYSLLCTLQRFAAYHTSSEKYGACFALILSFCALDLFNTVMNCF